MFRYSLAFCLAISCTVLFPFVTLATVTSSTPEMLPAGFATAPLWISNASPVDGDALKLFAVVNNSTATTVSDSASFLVDGMVVGSVKVSLDAGTAQILSTAWTAVVGIHNITTTFDQPIDASGQSVSLSGTMAGPLSITVSPAPPKPVVLQYLDTAMNAAGPALSGTLQSIENARQSGADYFATQLGLGIASAVPQGKVLGATAENLVSVTSTTAQTTNDFGTLVNRFGYFVFDNPMLFYPIILLLLFLALWLMFRIFSRK